MDGGEHHDGGLGRLGEQIRGGDKFAVACQIDDDRAARLIAEVHQCATIVFDGTDLDAKRRLAVVVQCENR